MRRNPVNGHQEASQSHYGLALFALVLIFLAVNARWIWTYRNGQPLDIDEAGYLDIALNDYNNFLRAGLHGWWSAVEGPSIQAPLTTLVASWVFALTGPHLVAGFLVPLACGAGCVLATYFLGKSVASQQVGLFAAILVACCPMILNYSRSFHFALPATLVMTAALLALIRSERFERMRWLLTFGVCLGLMPLARTMTIAFVPGVVAGAFVYAIAEPRHRLRRFLLLLLSLAIAAAVAATWFLPHGKYVFSYLLSFGYGAQAVEYGPAQSRFGFDAWLNTLRNLLNGVYFPYLVVMLAGAAAVIAVTFREALLARPADFLLRVLRSRKLPIIVAFAEALLALTSTRNRGSAFSAPIVPAILVIVVWAFLSISESRRYRRVVEGLFAAVAIFASVPLVDLRTPLASPWFAGLPLLGDSTISDGRGTLQQYEADSTSSRAAEPIGQDLGAKWIEASDEAVRTINSLFNPTAIVAFGVRNLLFNVNTVGLQELLDTGVQLGERQIEPTLTGDTVDGYLSWLIREGTDACILITSDKVTLNDFPPVIVTANMREAAQRAGFVPDRQLQLPDGQNIIFWKHRETPSDCD